MLMQKLQQERVVSAISTVAAAEAMLELAIDYCKNTIVNGKPLSKKQAVKFTLAELATETKMNRVFLDNLLLGHTAGESVIAETMMSKYASSELANTMADRLLDLFGDFGVLEASPLARSFRDLRITTIFAGTTEIMKTIIAQSMAL